MGQIKPIPSFRTRSLKTASGYLPWNPVVVSVSRLSSGWRIHLQYRPRSPSLYFLASPEPVQCRGRRILGCAPIKPPPPTVTTPLGIEKLIPSVYNLSSLIILLFLLHMYLHSLHLCTHCTLQSRINPTIIFALLSTFHSKLVVEYSIIITTVRTYPCRTDP